MQPEYERAQAYRAVLATTHGQTVLLDLVKLSQQNGISEGVAAGRADAVARFLLMQALASEPRPEPEKIQED